MSKARNLSDFISDPAIDSTELGDGSVTTAKLGDQAVTPAKLHNTMDLSSKTVTLATDGISGNSVHGGVISDFASTGIDDNASSTAITIDNSGNVGVGTGSPSNKLEVDGGAASTRLRISTTDPGASVAGLILANSSKSAFNDGIEIVHGAGVTKFNDLAGETQLSVDMTNSRVGIGTSSPSQKLHVDGIIRAGKAGNSSANLPALLVYASGVNSDQAAIAIQQGTGEGDTIIFADFNPYVEYGINTDNGADAIDFTSGVSTGNIGINKTLYNNNGDARTAHVKMRVNLNSGILEVGGGVKGAFVPYNTTLQVSLAGGNSSYTWSGLPANVWMMMSVHLASTDADDDDHYDVKFGPVVDYGTTWGTTYAGNVSYGLGIATHPGDGQGTFGQYGKWDEIMAQTNSSGQMILSIVGSNGGSGVTVRTKGYFLG